MIQNSWGPIAMLSSPNLLGSFQNSAFYQAMLPQIMLNNNTSIGDCFKNTYQNNIPLNAFSYQLFGDPALIPRIVNNEHQIAEPLVLKLSVNDQTIFVSIFPRDSWTKVKLPLSHYTHLFEDTTEILSLEQISLIPYFAQNEFTHGNILIDDFALGELFSQNFEGGLNSLEIQQLQNNLTISLNWDVPGSQGQSLEMTFDRSNSDSLLSSISLFLDPNLELSITDTISFWIKQGEVTLSTDPSGIQTPASFEFAQPYPNPFNASTRLTFSLPSAGIVHFTAYDITGRQVWQMSPQKYSSGVNSFTWQPVNLSSGIYLIRMESGPFVANRKVLMVK